jgi:phosphoglycolate phosphatase-like HAD superfamily hydrolase
VIRRLLLWDVDGTLLHAGELGAAVFDVALELATGRRPTGRIRMSGKTDPQIVGEYLSAMGLDDPDLVLHVLRHSEGLLAEAAAAGRLTAGGQACPGIAAVLARLAEDPRVVSTLLTGNIEPNALVKVTAFGLDRWLDPTVGAYGSDAADRNLLVPVALRRLSDRRGVELAPGDAWVIGDTPRDLACARAAGSRCLLVATGRYRADELAELEPDALLEDLRDGPAVVKLLTGDL